MVLKRSRVKERNVLGSFKRGLVAKISDEELRIIIGKEKYSVYNKDSEIYVKPSETKVHVLCVFSGPKQNKEIYKIYNLVGDRIYYQRKN